MKDPLITKFTTAYLVAIAGATAVIGHIALQPPSVPTVSLTPEPEQVETVLPVATTSDSYNFSAADIKKCEYYIRTTLMRPDTFEKQWGWRQELTKTGELFYSYEDLYGTREYSARSCVN